MIRTISSKIPTGEKLTVGLVESDPSGYTIVSWTGLGPPKSTISAITGPFDGAHVNGVVSAVRTITLTLAINGYGDDEESERLAIYKWFPIKTLIEFGVTTDTNSSVIDAWVEDVVMNMNAPIENVVITLYCAEPPYFKDANTSRVYFYGSHPTFEFPFSNESLTDPLIQFGEFLDLVEQPITYDGDVDTGVICTIDIFDTCGDILFANHTWGTSIFIDESVVEAIAGGPLDNGDTITIDTRIGEKSLTLFRGGIVYNILNAIDIFTIWPTLKPGYNLITLSTEGPVDSVRMEMTYNALRGGV